jgi:hypothetical protein
VFASIYFSTEWLYNHVIRFGLRFARWATIIESSRATRRARVSGDPKGELLSRRLIF